MKDLFKNYFTFSGRMNRQAFFVIVLAALFVQFFALSPLLGTKSQLSKDKADLIATYKYDLLTESPLAYKRALPQRIYITGAAFIRDYMTWMVVFVLILPPLIQRLHDLNIPQVTIVTFPVAIIAEAAWAVSKFDIITSSEEIDAISLSLPYIIIWLEGIALLYLLAIMLAKGDRGYNPYGDDPVHHVSPMEEAVAVVDETLKKKQGYKADQKKDKGENTGSDSDKGSNFNEVL